MRELKFRVWDKKNSRFIKLAGFKIQDGQLLPYEWVGKDKWFFIPEEVEIMQFTGLKDKNGKEIYEGDICQWFDDKREILFEDGCFVAIAYRPDGSPVLSSAFGRDGNPLNYEVIGNIYESPELLK